MVADVPLGAFLSGGIDSALIVALMQKYGARTARTFTLGFSEKWYDEAEDARAVAKRLETEHTELYVTPSEAAAVIPRLGSIYDEPFADSSQVPTFLVSEMARRYVTVALSGDGGDEIFGGYNRYVWASKVWNWISPYPRFLRTMGANLAMAVSPGTWDRWSTLAPRGFQVKAPGDKMHKLAGILDARSQKELYERLISQWAEAESVVVGGDQPASGRGMDAPWDVGSTFLQHMMLRDSVGYLPNDILVKVDRAAMAVSLETRAPYLDHRLFEFIWSLPDEWKVRGRESKWLLRQVLYRHVPREMMQRPKSGFGIPIHVWLRGPLRDWAENLLDERRLRDDGFLAPAPIRKKWRQHLAGSHNWYPQLWAVLMFQSWLQARSDVPTQPMDVARVGTSETEICETE
jgi:asparagine synthase (glutamine-hydrolysing)